MKKIFAMMMVLILAFSMMACAQKPQENPILSVEPLPEQTAEPTPAPTEEPKAEVNLTLAEIMEAIYADITVELPALGTMELDGESYEFYAFTPYVDGMEALVSEAMIGSIAHSVVLTRVPEGTDVNETAAQIEANMDPRKWICVEAESASVLVHDDVILMVMASKDAHDQLCANFEALWAN